MKRIVVVWLICFLFIVPGSFLHGAVSHHPSLDWRTLESDHFLIHFHNGELELARQTAAVAESAHERLSRFFNWQPADKTDVVLSDEADNGGGFAMAIPYNRTTIRVSPAAARLTGTDDWLERLFVHEYTHILHLDKAGGAPLWLRNIFGRLPFFFPGMLQPSWLLEGLSSYMERDDEYGAATRGAAGSTYYDSIMRLETAHGIKPLNQVSMSLDNSLSDWPGFLTRYTYGLHFYQFLESRYGKEAVMRLVEEYSDNLIPFMINSNSQRILGKSLGQLWQEFEQYLHDRYDEKIRSITDSGYRAETVISSHKSAYSPTMIKDTLYYLEYNGFEHRRLMRMREGTAEKLIDVNPGAAIDGNENSGILLSQTETCSNTFDVSDLYHWDPETEELSRLTRCARYIGGRWSPDGKLIAAIKNELGRHRIDLLTSDGTFIKTLFEGEQWDAVLGGDWSPDGKFIVVSLYRRGLGSDLYRFELESGSKTRLTRTRESETSPVFSNDGQSLYFSADYGGVSNIHRLVLAGGRIEQITDVLGGANRPRRGAGKTLLYSAMTPKGTEIHRLPRPVSLGDSVTSEQGDTRMTGFESGNRFSTVATRPYSPFYSGRPSWWLPFFEIGDDRTGVGISTSGSDVLDRHRYSLGIGWEFENDLAIWDLSYTYDRWYPTLRLGVNRSNDLYRDDQGDLERIRREDSGKVELIFPWIKQERIFALDIGAVWELRSDVMHSKQLESEPDERDNLLGAALVWDNTKHYSYSISSQDGRRITAVVESGGLLGSDFDGTVYRFDWREYFSLWKNHVLATRLAVGRSDGKTTPFELGGFFGSGYDGISALLYGGLAASPFNIREFALRGYSDGRKSLSGSSMNLFSLEYRFPLKLIERTWTVPPLGIDRLSGSLFAESGAAWDSTTTSEEYHSAAGVEINGRFSIGYWLPLGFRLGYGYGFDQGGEDRLYLSVGSSF